MKTFIQLKLMAGIALLTGASLMSGCGSATDSTVSMQLGTYSVAQNSILDWLFPSAYATPVSQVSNVSLCFKRLRFKSEGEESSADPTADNDNVDLQIGEVSLVATGTTLGDVTIPAGTYTRVEFDLEKDCNGYSIKFDHTTHGTMQTDARTTIKFEGSFEANDSSETLALGIEAILNALENVTADTASIKTQAESASGSM